MYICGRTRREVRDAERRRQKRAISMSDTVLLIESLAPVPTMDVLTIFDFEVFITLQNTSSVDLLPENSEEGSFLPQRIASVPNPEKVN